MSRGKLKAEEYIKAARACLEGEMSQAEVARQYGVNASSVQEWIARYRAGGALAFRKQEHNNIYSSNLKRAAVEAYLSGAGSLLEVATKYGLRSKTQLERWIKVYNSGRDFKHKMSGGSHMKTSRKTTQNERIEIARYCLENGCNYGETALRYGVSYQQVYTWVQRFRKLGAAGLEDRRGKRTAQQTPRTPEEELKIRIAQLEHELYLTKMERDLLKKLDEIERREAYRK